jgi:membrane fusion protein (multidrug efflux system)
MYRFTGIALSIGYFFLAYWLLVGQFYQTHNNAYISGNIVKIFADNPGHVSTVLVEENTLVVKGQPIAMIDGAAAYFKLKNAEETLVNAIKQAKEMNQVANQLQNKSKTTLKNAENELMVSQKKYKASLEAYSNQLLSLEAMQQAQISVEKASDTLEEARLEDNAAASLPIYQSLVDAPLVHEAMDQLRLAYLNWIKSTIYAPDTGYITAREVTPGQAVNTRTVLMTMVPLNQMWVNVNVKSSQLKNISYGEPVKLVANLNSQNPAYKGIIVGQNDTIQNTSRNSVSIRIQINPDELIKHPLRFGLAMTAIINTRHHDEKPLVKIDDRRDTLVAVTDYREELIPANQIIDKIVQDNTKNKGIPGTRLGSLEVSRGF